MPFKQRQARKLLDVSRMKERKSREKKAAVPQGEATWPRRPPAAGL